MNESVLHHVWQHRLFKQFALRTCTGETVEIIDAGRLNRDAGPDFFNAKVKVDGTIWAGNIEIHIRSSDWFKHNHHLNKAYDNVILHVVNVIDVDVFTTKGVKIPQMQLNFSEETALRIHSFLVGDNYLLKCNRNLSGIDSVFWNDWKNALLLERLEKKCRDVQKPDEDFVDPDEILYRLLVRSFGTHLNADVFLSLAINLPFRIVRRYLNQPISLMALFAGHAGFLTKNCFDKQQELMQEYAFLKKKFGLTEINPERWLELRTRPQNFPFNRLLQMVVLLMNFLELKKLITNDADLPGIVNLLKVSGSKEVEFLKQPDQFKQLTPDFINHLLINAILPFVYYQNNKVEGESFEKIAECFIAMKPERNSLMTNWINAGVQIRNAFDSQALLQLYQHYCKEKKCLRCRIGHQVLKKIIELPEILPEKI